MQFVKNQCNRNIIKKSSVNIRNLVLMQKIKSLIKMANERKIK